jgi:hypothetical protein
MHGRVGRCLDYDFRFLVGDASIARSNPVTVNATSSPLPAVPTLLVDGGTASSREIGETLWVTGSGFSPGGMVMRYIDPSVNESAQIAPLTADQLGNVTWVFTPRCGNFNPQSTIYAVDAESPFTARSKMPGFVDPRRAK